MIPVNQVLNSQRMIQTGQYQIKQSKGCEDIWLIAFLKSEGRSEEEIKSIWRPVYATRHGEEGDEYIESVFLSYCDTASAWRLFMGKPIVFFREEIEKINATNLLPWIKEYALMTLGYFKCLGKTKQPLELFPGAALRRMTSCKRVQENINEISRCCRAGLLNISQSITMSRYTNEEHEWRTVSVLFSRDCGEEVFRAETLLDVPKAFDLLKNEKVCSLCGKTFEVGSKTKRDVCYDCWRAKRALRPQNIRTRHEKAF